jgi:RNA polymerase sigma-70 factor (ECF subfamily)
MDASQLAAVQAARDSYGRLLASLAYQWRDIAAAEDALAEAFAAALTHWPRTGVPRSPDAWLTTAAKRNLLHAARHQRVVLDPAVTILLAQDEAAPGDEANTVIPDERLRLLLVCAHPEIDADVRTPLMLQVVLGLEAKHIASAMLLKPATLAQRLVRAKARIRDAGLRFELPQSEDLAARSHAVLDAIYGAYTLGWHHTALDSTSTQTELASEALFLAELCAKLLPANVPGSTSASAEALGLLALLRFCEARRDAGLSPEGDFIPLHQQDTTRWNTAQLVLAEAGLMQAFALAAPTASYGPYQLEAAIQSAHCERVRGGAVPWPDIARLYEQLLAMAPTTGAQLGYAVAVAESQGPDAGLALLQGLPADALVSYQPYWVTRAHLLSRTGKLAEAKGAYVQAIGLTENPAIRRYLMGFIDRLTGVPDPR